MTDVQADPTPSNTPPTPIARRYDVVIIGAGLAGLTLARHLLLETGKRILLIEQRESIPTERQKVGESTVQLAGHYLGKVLGLEEHLFLEHFMKYNLRFMWRAENSDGAAYEDYGHSYIRAFSNIPSYQVDRNVLEAELIRRNLAHPSFDLALGARRVDADMAEGDGDHVVRFRRGDDRFEVESRWVVDASGRNRVLAKRHGLKQPSEIRHGASFLWVEGQVDLESLTQRTRKERRLDPAKRHLGHLPTWLATNHFCGEGFWLWVIPLRGKTSIGLVYEHDSIDPSAVSSEDKLKQWIKAEFPIFEPVLDGRRTLDWWGFRSFAHSCSRTIHPQRWAITGEAGRFSDPLYSPGSDLISVYNTLIVDAIEAEDQAALEAKSSQAEALMKAVYEAYVPGYALTYQTLGNQETFSIKYIWELTIYFGFYVFPFMNDLLTNRRFLATYLNAFARLGPINHRIQRLLAGYYRFKKENGRLGTASPRYFDFTALGPLDRAAHLFYEVGVSTDAAKTVIREALSGVEELARFIVTHIAAQVVGAPEMVTNASFVERVAALDKMAFDPEVWRHACAEARADDRQYEWSFDPRALEVFSVADSTMDPVVQPASEPIAEAVT